MNLILSDIKNPIRAVQCLIEDSIEPSDAYLCPPLFLVGPHAEKYALSKGLSQASLISSTATKQWKASRALISDSKNIPLPRLDTIGAMLLFAGTSIASCSSGGLILKSPGRIGHVTYLDCFHSILYILVRRRSLEQGVLPRKLISLLLRICYLPVLQVCLPSYEYFSNIFVILSVGLGEFLMESGGICSQWVLFFETLLNVIDLKNSSIEEIFSLFIERHIVGSVTFKARDSPPFVLITLIRECHASFHSQLLVASNCPDIFFGVLNRNGKIQRKT